MALSGWHRVGGDALGQGLVGGVHSDLVLLGEVFYFDDGIGHGRSTHYSITKIHFLFHPILPVL